MRGQKMDEQRDNSLRERVERLEKAVEELQRKFGKSSEAWSKEGVHIAVFFLMGVKSSKSSRSGADFLINFKEFVLRDYWFDFNNFGCLE